MKLKKITLRILVDILMYSILIISLFPIFWMVVTSLKSNYDILLGRIGFSRESNAIVSIYKNVDKGILFFSKDGFAGYTTNKGVNKVKDFHTKALSSLDLTNSYVLTNGFEIFLYDKFNRTFTKKYNFSGLPWKLKNQMLSTSIAKVGDNYVLGKVIAKTEADKDLRYTNQNQFEGLVVFDRNFNYLRTITDLNIILDPNINLLATDNNLLFIGSSEGLSLYNFKTNSLFAKYTNLNDPDFKNIRSVVKIGNKLLITTDSFVFSLNLTTKALRKISSKLHDLNVVTYYKDKLYLGSDNGLYVANYNFSDDSLRNLKCIFSDKAKFWAVNSFFLDKNNLWIGLGNGQLIDLDINKLNILNSYSIRKGAYDIRWANYIEMWQNISFGTYVTNSFLICLITVLVALFMATTAGYALSRFRFPGSSLFSSSILAVNMIPPLLILIPIYLMYIKVYDITGIPLVGTYPGIIALYATWFIPMSIWILRSFFAAIPVEIEEAARIDGCNRFQVFWKIALPLAMPGIIATGIYIFLIAWDELLFATILLPEKNMFTIPLGIKLYIGNHQNRFDLMMAAATVATLPVLVLFFMVQRWFIKGLTAGAVKG